MLFTCCTNKCGSFYTGIIASLIIGIITAFLTITATITVTPVFLWVVFGIAIVYLSITLIISPFIRKDDRCSCFNSILTTLLLAILGCALFAVILLAITFAATSVLGAIITGALLFFFSLVLTSSASLIKCIASYSD